jgi:hypothetical protein
MPVPHIRGDNPRTKRVGSGHEAILTMRNDGKNLRKRRGTSKGARIAAEAPRRGGFFVN